jgi:predicted nucleic acid-binding Zn ribbon protein
MNDDPTYIDGNAAAGTLSEIFAADITAARTHCAHCGAEKHFAQAFVFSDAPGLVSRCSECDAVLLRVVTTKAQMFLDMRGITFLCFDLQRPGG